VVFNGKMIVASEFRTTATFSRDNTGEFQENRTDTQSCQTSKWKLGVLSALGKKRFKAEPAAVTYDQIRTFEKGYLRSNAISVKPFDFEDKKYWNDEHENFWIDTAGVNNLLDNGMTVEKTPEKFSSNINVIVLGSSTYQTCMAARLKKIAGEILVIIDLTICKIT